MSKERFVPVNDLVIGRFKFPTTGDLILPESASPLALESEGARIEVIDIGPGVNKQHYPINVGDFVLLKDQRATALQRNDQEVILAFNAYAITAIIKTT